MIKYAIMDLDSCAYLGASVAIKTIYQWVEKGTDNTSPEFTKASDAREWIERESAFEGADPSQWQRTVRTVDLGERKALVALDNEMKSWLRTARELSGNPNIKLLGWITSSGVKNKDIKGLPFRYQHNRYDKLGDDYHKCIPKPKPCHLQSCREYLLRYYDFVKVSPDSIEADAPCILAAEKHGYEALLMSKDKDLKQAMNVNYVDMNDDERNRKLLRLDELGYLEKKTVRVVEEEISGTGFKLLCMQTCAGDASDGYKGINLFGPKKALPLLEPCETVEQCCEVLVNLYKDKYKDGYQYTSWDGKEVNLSWQETLIQHNKLAYHERGSKDKKTPIERYLAGDDPIFRAHRRGT